MRHVISIGLLSLIISAFGIVPTAAITGGAPDGEVHPSVGVLFFRHHVTFPDTGNGIQNFHFCSGTLIAPDMFLTAAHCVYNLTGGALDSVWVSLDTAFTSFEEFACCPPVDPTPNEPRAQISRVLVHPEFKIQSLGVATPDVAVLVLDLSTATGPLPDFSDLPPAGILGYFNEKHGLAGTRFTNVGYGDDVLFGRGSPKFISSFFRQASESEFRALTPQYLVLSQNPSTDDAGTCFGDSGGPGFLRLDDTREVVAAIAISGDAVCRATNIVYRLDTEDARSFLRQAGLPLP
jgi:hypothetical protein